MVNRFVLFYDSGGSHYFENNNKLAYLGTGVFEYSVRWRLRQN